MILAQINVNFIEDFWYGLVGEEKVRGWWAEGGGSKFRKGMGVVMEFMRGSL